MKDPDREFLLIDTEDLMRLVMRGRAVPEHRQASRALFSWLLSRMNSPVQAVPREFWSVVDALQDL